MNITLVSGNRPIWLTRWSTKYSVFLLLLLLLSLLKCFRFHVCLIFYRLMPSPLMQVSIEQAKRLGGVDRLIRNITFFLHVFFNFFLFFFSTQPSTANAEYCTHIILYNHLKSKKKNINPTHKSNLFSRKSVFLFSLDNFCLKLLFEHFWFLGIKKQETRNGR